MFSIHTIDNFTVYLIESVEDLIHANSPSTTLVSIPFFCSSDSKMFGP